MSERTELPPGVRVEKSVYPDHEPWPAVFLWIANEQGQPVDLEVFDPPPRGATVDDVDFSRFERDRWRYAAPDGVLYRRTVDAHAVVVARYCVRTRDVPAEGHPPPTIRSVDHSREASLQPVSVQSIPANRVARFENVSSVDRGDDGDHGAERDRRLIPDGGQFEDEHEPDRAADGESGDDRGSVRGSAVFHSEFDAPERDFPSLLADHQPISWGEVTRTMVAELRHGDVDDETIAELRDALAEAADDGDGATASDAGRAAGATDDDVSRPVDVRLDRLHAKVERVAAYTDALEEFIGEHGTGQQAIDNLSRRLDTVEQELDAVTDSIGELQSEVRQDNTRLDDLESTVADLTEDVHALQDRTARRADLEALQDRVDELEDLETRVDDVEAVADSQAAGEGVDDRLDALDERTGALEDSLSSLEDRLDTLSTTVEEGMPSEDLEPLADDLAAVSDRVEALESAMDDLENRVGAVQSTVDETPEADVEELAETVASNEETLASMRETVDRLDETLKLLSEIGSDPTTEPEEPDTAED